MCITRKELANMFGMRFSDGMEFPLYCRYAAANHQPAKNGVKAFRVWLEARKALALVRGLNFLERRLVESHTTVIIPFDDRVIFVRLLNCAEFSSWLSEVAQSLDATSGIQFLVGGRGLGERWPLGTV
jgi:hypothetical protein